MYIWERILFSIQRKANKIKWNLKLGVFVQLHLTCGTGVVCVIIERNNNTNNNQRRHCPRLKPFSSKCLIQPKLIENQTFILSQASQPRELSNQVCVENERQIILEWCFYEFSLDIFQLKCLIAFQNFMSVQLDISVLLPSYSFK